MPSRLSSMCFMTRPLFKVCGDTPLVLLKVCSRSLQCSSWICRRYSRVLGACRSQLEARYQWLVLCTRATQSTESGGVYHLFTQQQTPCVWLQRHDLLGMG